MPLNSRPVVQTLQRQVNVLIRFQFQDGEPSFERQRQHIDHRPVCRGKRRDLRIHGLGCKPLVDHADVGAHQRLQPPLGMHSKQPVVARPRTDAGIPQCGEQLDEKSPIAVF